MPARPIAQLITWGSSTGTGGSTGKATFGTGMAVAGAWYTFTGSTKAVSVKLQGGAGGSTVWRDISAASTLSTGAAGGSIMSTATTVFDKVRLNVTVNDTTGNGTLAAWVLARP